MPASLALMGMAIFAGLAILAGLMIPGSQAMERPLPALLLLLCLSALVFHDIRSLRLPDWLTLPLALAGLVLAGLDLIGVTLLLSALGAVIGYCALYGLAEFWRRTQGVEGIGLGDAKLLAAGGAWCGALNLPIICLMGAFLGLAGVALARLTGRLSQSGRERVGGQSIPFGPFLGMGIWLSWCLNRLAIASV